jgi:hypothetical protein
MAAESFLTLILYCTLFTFLFVSSLYLLLFSLKSFLPEAKYLIELTSILYRKLVRLA